MSIYLDNAATSFPKPEAVPAAVYDYMTTNGCNINRGTYQSAYDASEMVYDTRRLLCDLFHAPDTKNVIFTSGTTASLNIVLKGLLRPGDRVLTSAMEHNAVMRPLVQLQDNGVSFARIPCNSAGELFTGALRSMTREPVRAIVMTHASNVCGTVMPIETVGNFCHEHGIYFIVDAAQTAGLLPIDMERMHIDALCFSAHKGLYGPQGIGALLLTDALAAELTPLLSGGTGSVSHTETIPDFLPDMLEPGTPNLPGIAGWYAALKFIEQTGIDRIREHDLALTKRFLDGLKQLPDIQIVGLPDVAFSDASAQKKRSSVVSVRVPKKDPSDIAAALDAAYQIATRVGLHCAPNAHKTLGTYPEGTIRFSFGYFNTTSDVDAALDALEALLTDDF